MIAALLLAAAPAHAADGTAEAPSYGGAGSGELEGAQQQIDRTPATSLKKPKPKPRATRAGNPLLTSFSIARSRVYLFGRPAPVTFQVNDRSATVAVRLKVVDADTGETARVVDLGEQTTGVPHTYRFTGREGGALPAGQYRIRVRAHDAAGHPLARSAHTSAVDELAVYPYCFPVKGNFDYSSPDGRFGAKRDGHTHQGNDIPAPEGTPIRAVRGGVVKTIAYQKDGAGNYLVLDAAGDKHDFVYMHIESGSFRVEQGRHVRTGEWIANVGNTGASFGAHLHFEVWDGPWFAGGEAIDPWPFLRRWDRWS